MNSRSGGAPRSSACADGDLAGHRRLQRQRVDALADRRHDEDREEEREPEQDLVRRHFLRAERLPQEMEDDDDSCERRHRHQHRGDERQQRQQEDDLQRRRDVADALDVDSPHCERRRLGLAAPRRSTAVSSSAENRERREAFHGVVCAPVSSAPWPSTSAASNDSPRSSSVTSEIWTGVSPSSSRRPSTATTISDRRSPSGTVASMRTRLRAALAQQRRMRRAAAAHARHRQQRQHDADRGDAARQLAVADERRRLHRQQADRFTRAPRPRPSAMWVTRTAMVSSMITTSPVRHAHALHRDLQVAAGRRLQADDAAGRQRRAGCAAPSSRCPSITSTGSGTSRKCPNGPSRSRSELDDELGEEDIGHLGAEGLRRLARRCPS